MISVSIVTYKTSIEEVERCVHCLLASEHVAWVMVVDNGNDASLEKYCIENLGDRVRYVDHENNGYGSGHNIAIRESSEKYHLVINSDIYFENGVLDYLYKYMEEHGDVGQSIPLVHYPNGHIQYACRLLPSPLDVIFRRFLPSSWGRKRDIRYTLQETGFNKEMNVPYHMGCFMLFRRSSLEEIAIVSNGYKQYFDERFFLYPEDIDITRRMHRSYKTMFVPGVSIIHAHRAASYHNARMLCIHIYNMCKYFNKWGWFFDKERTLFNERVLDSVRQSNQP